MNLFSQRRKIEKSKSKNPDVENTRLRLEEKYYKDLDNLHEQYDIVIHDMKHTLRTIAALSDEGNYEEITQLIGKMRVKLGNIDEQLICSHKILNALLTERKVYADENGVVLELEISEPLYLQQIDDLDLITLMGNLLDNAIEAEMHSGKQDGILCNMHMSNGSRHVVIQVENSYEEKRRNTIRKTSINEKHGIGLKSVNEIVKKYGGILESNKNEGRYNVKVILPIQGDWKAGSYTEPVPAYAQSTFK